MTIRPILIRSVSEATAIIKCRLDDLPVMTIEGEVSNFRPANASGHLYFTLGDDTAKLDAIFFAYAQRLQGPLPKFENGSKVRVTGKIGLYAPAGRYALHITKLELCNGVGELLKRFEALKKQLHDEGLCDARRKRPLPVLPKRIGIVTAPTGAAIRDILSILDRRFPNLHIVIAPCRVQGQEAIEEIARAIELLNRHFGPESTEPLDAMIVGRGGGSLEDLWCFNEERVVRAVAASRIPIISAVGHEPDTALTDFVADVRAATPSAAAELLCARKEDLAATLQDRKARLLQAMRGASVAALNAVHRHGIAFDRTRGGYVVRTETSALERAWNTFFTAQSQRIDLLETRSRSALTEAIPRAQQRLVDAMLRLERLKGAFFPRAQQLLTDRATRLDFAFNRALDARAAKLRATTAQFEAYNPYAVLRRGYALVTDATGHTLTDATTVTPHDPLTIRLATGSLAATVTAITAEELIG